MGNTASSAEFVTAALDFCRSPLPPGASDARATLLGRLFSGVQDTPAEDVFATLQPRDVRACLRRNPYNLGVALLEATRLLHAFTLERLRGSASGSAQSVSAVQALNAVRVLTRLLPVLLEDSVRPDFMEEVFWNNRLPVPVAALAPEAEAAPAPGAEGEASAAPPAEAAAAAPAEAEPAPPAPAPLTLQEVSWQPFSPEESAFLGGRQLGAVLVDAVAAAAFTPGFTITKEQWQVYQLKIKAFEEAAAPPAALPAPAGGEEAAAPTAEPGAAADDSAAAAAASAAPGLPAADDAAALAAVTPTLANAVWPMLMWSSGIFFSAIEPPVDPKVAPARAEVLRLLIVLCSGTLYKVGDAASPTRSPFADVLVGGDCPFIPTLFFSLLNVVTSYDPVGWAVPYAGAVWADPNESVVDLASQALLVLLDYAPLITVDEVEGGGAEGDGSGPSVFTQFNLCRSLLAGLANPAEFTALFNALTRLLNTVPQADAAMLPGSVSAVRCVPELLVLVWKLVDGNPAFLRHIVTRCDVTALVGPVAYFMWNGRKNVTQVGLVHMCTFLLLLLSGDRAFGVALNKPCPRKALPLDCPALDTSWSYADFLIVTLHMCMIDALPKFSTLFGCWLTVIANISPYTKALSPTAAARLLTFFELFSSPRFMLSGPNNYVFTQQVVEALNNLVQYQFETNAALVHVILQRREAVSRFIGTSWEEAAAAAGLAVEAQEEEAEEGVAAIADGGEGGEGAPAASEGEGEEAEAAEELGTAVPSTVAGPEVEGAAPAAEPSSALVPAPVPPAAAAPWAPSASWYYGVRATIPMLTLARLIEYLCPLVQEHATSAGVPESDPSVLDFIRATTLVGVLPVPHPILMRRYTPNIYTGLWFTTFIWSTVYLHASQALPLFDAEAIKLFAITLAA